MTKLGSAIGARLIRASLIADRGFQTFDRLRSLLVTSLASDATLEAYNDLAYGATRTYDASSPQFRTELFNWEAELVARIFPAPPGRVLVGGAGGGREAFELAARGYAVTAFEPSVPLARSMADKAARTGAPVDVLVGRYEDLPRLRRLNGEEVVDLAAAEPFKASILGWSSYSHLRHRPTRVAALRRFAEITEGPVAASFFMRPDGKGISRHPIGRFSTRLGLREAGDSFSPHIGFFHLSSMDELLSEVAEAGLTVLETSRNSSDGYWPWVAVARPDVAPLPASSSESPRPESSR